jgi:hypothetical protein
MSRRQTGDREQLRAVKNLVRSTGCRNDGGAEPLPKKTISATMMIKMIAMRRIHHHRDLRLVGATLSGSAAARALRCDLDNFSVASGSAA